jgi:hypothetical protein
MAEAEFTGDGGGCSLSLGERAGVRANAKPVSPSGSAETL